MELKTRLDFYVFQCFIYFSVFYNKLYFSHIKSDLVKSRVPSKYLCEPAKDLLLVVRRPVF